MTHEQNKPIFLCSIDNSVDFEGEVPQTFDTEEEALNAAKETTDDFGLRTYVYKCIPIIRVDRGNIRVTRLNKGGRP